jgi:hypothetical protein
MPNANRFVEVLESRTLMSTSGLNASIAADQTAIHADLLKFRADCLNANATTVVNALAIKTNDPSDDTILTSLVNRLRSSTRRVDIEMVADRLTQGTTVVADESAIVEEQLQIVQDRGNTAEEAADKSQLVDDRIALRTAMISVLNARLTIREAAETTLATNSEAIVTAVGNDSNASTALKNAVTTFTTDRHADIAKVSSDIATLITARQKLVTDLNASLDT